MQWVLHLIFRSPHFRAEIPHFYQTKYSAINRNLKSTDWRSSVSIGCLFIFFGIFNFHLFISPFFLFFFPRRTTQFLFGFFLYCSLYIAHKWDRSVLSLWNNKKKRDESKRNKTRCVIECTIIVHFDHNRQRSEQVCLCVREWCVCDCGVRVQFVAKQLEPESKKGTKIKTKK